jgi:hypothetical protein
MEQDIYLNNATSVTHFKVTYRRHTNFSLECPYTNVYNRKNDRKNDRKYNNFDIIVTNCGKNEKKNHTNCLKMIAF